VFKGNGRGRLKDGKERGPCIILSTSTRVPSYVTVVRYFLINCNLYPYFYQSKLVKYQLRAYNKWHPINEETRQESQVAARLAWIHAHPQTKVQFPPLTFRAAGSIKTSIQPKLLQK